MGKARTIEPGEDTSELPRESGPISTVRPTLSLVISEGAETRTFQLRPGQRMALGRAADCEIVVKDCFVSRRHVAFQCSDGQVVAEDLGSKNALQAGRASVRRFHLALGDTLQVGSVTVRAVPAPSDADASVTRTRWAPHANDSSPLGLRSANRAMQAVDVRLARAARTDLTVMVYGETGTGKELAARALHAGSARSGGPFVAVNCGAIPSQLVEMTLFGAERGSFTGADKSRGGLFEAAHGGTLFLDEIGELSLAAQAALLRVVETRCVRRIGGTLERPIDVRFVGATHRDLREATARGNFREDLFHRFSAVEVTLPPLRSRTEDLEALTLHFLAQAGHEHSLSACCWQRLHAYHWPGNLRELRNVVISAAAMCAHDVLTQDDLPEHVDGGRRSGVVEAPRSPKPMEMSAGVLRAQRYAFEQLAVEEALREASGDRQRACEALGISMRTLERRLQRARTDAPLLPTARIREATAEKR